MKFIDDTEVPHQPYPELHGILEAFVQQVSAQLNKNLVGIYLVGSLASGDFDLDSDIDFLVVTSTEVNPADMAFLQSIHENIYQMDGYPAKHLEGSYISLGDLNDWSSVGTKQLYYFDNGSTTYEQNTHDNKWHVRWVLRERGITLLGPRSNTLLPAIPIHEMLDEVKKGMQEGIDYFQEEMHGPLNYANTRFGQPFFVLTYCRMLHTLHTGTVQSKKAGAAWAKQVVDQKWVPLIDQAWKEREGVRFGIKIGQRAEQVLLDQTLEFMRYVVGQANNL